MDEDNLSIITESRSNELPTRRETLNEALASLVTVGNSGIGGVILFALGVMFLAWTADCIFPFLQDLSVLLYAGVTGTEGLKQNLLNPLAKRLSHCFYLSA
ncbi:MAG TPA: hypothetical protein VF648_05815 [Pyrinomonadaceae bacterium]|jgi:uncharacterized membrane protein